MQNTKKIVCFKVLKMDDLSKNFVEESFISTPKPQASSTIAKKQHIRHLDKKYGPVPMNFSAMTEEGSSSSSIGILNMDDIELSVDIKDDNALLNQLIQQRKLAENTLERASIRNKVDGLPSKYFRSDSLAQESSTTYFRDNSTITESDLINKESIVNSQSFKPNDISTPRNSDVPETPFDGRSIFHNITEMSEKIRNSDISLQDICMEFNKMSLEQAIPAISAIDSQVFTPAEFMTEKLLKDELSWRREKDVPADLLKESILENDSYQEKYSMGDFFKGRSNEISDMFNKVSPEKTERPIPLVDVTNTLDDIHQPSRLPNNSTISQERESSVMSISKIAEALNEFSNATPSKVVDHLLHKGKKHMNDNRPSRGTNTLDKQNANKDEYLNRRPISKRAKENDCDDFIKSQELDRRSISPIHVPSLRTEDSLIGRASKRGLKHSLSPTDSTSLIRSNSPIVSKNTNLSQSYFKSSEMFRFPSAESLLKCCTSSNDESEANFSVSPQSPKNNSGKNKENCSQDRSLNSVRCASSLDSLPEGKLPIKGNKIELIWGCVKVGRNSTQEFCIRNQLNQRIRMQVCVTGSSFRIVKDRGDSDMLTTMIFMLHPLETKSMSCMFCPTSLGAVYERLNFCPISNGEIVSTMKQTIMLFGYGGHASIEITKVAKDSNGKLLLSLGTLEHNSIIAQEFSIRNNGVLAAFAFLHVAKEGFSNIANLKIHPHEFVLRPQEEVIVTITYTPSKQDYIHPQEIIEVGSIKLVSGAEVIRGRLRRLCSISKQKSDTTDSLLVKLCTRFHNEYMPHDLAVFKESGLATKELLQHLQLKEIRITIEKDPDSTLIGPMTEFDDTTMYQTLYQDLTVMKSDSTTKNVKPSQFTVEPTSIFFSLPLKKEDTVLIHSNSPLEMPFEVICESEAFEVTPKSGILTNGKTVVLKVSAAKILRGGRESGKVLIYVENEVMEVEVISCHVKLK